MQRRPSLYAQIVFHFEDYHPGCTPPKQSTRYKGIKRRNDKVYNEPLVITDSLGSLTTKSLLKWFQKWRQFSNNLVFKVEVALLSHEEWLCKMKAEESKSEKKEICKTLCFWEDKDLMRSNIRENFYLNFDTSSVVN